MKNSFIKFEIVKKKSKLNFDIETFKMEYKNLKLMGFLCKYFLFVTQSDSFFIDFFRGL